MMAEIKDLSRIAQNSTFLNISTILNNLIGLVLAVSIGRYLGKEGFGSYVFAFSFVALFAIFTDLGIPDLTTRELARDKTKAGKYLGNIIVMKILLAGLTLGLIHLVVNLAGFTSSVKAAVCIAAVYMVIEYFGRFFDSVFNAFERMEFTALLGFLLKLLILIGVLTATRLGFGLQQILWAYVCGGTIYVIICIRLLTVKFATPEYGIDRLFWKELIKASFPFALIWMFTVSYNKIDITILKAFHGETAVGLYGAATRTLMAIMFIPTNLSTALYPAFSRFYNTAKDHLFKYYYKSFQLLLICALPLAIGTTILAKRFIVLFWGQDYVEAGAILQILIWRTAILFLIALLRVLLISANRQNLLTVVMFWVLALSIGLNLLFIPYFGYIGASIVALVTTFISFCAYFIYANKKICRINLAALLIKPVVAAALMGSFVFLFKELNLTLLVVSSAITYLCALLLLKIFTREDLALIRGIFRKEPAKS